MADSHTARYSTRIRELPSSERPRERLRDSGPSALSNSELLAIILRTGTAEMSALALASQLIARHGGLGGLARLSFAELTRERGLGAAKAAEVMAVFQLALRFNALQPEERPFVRSPQDVSALLGGEMAMLDQEHLRVILLSTRNQVMSVAEVYRGNVGHAVVRRSELFREAIRQNAPCMILVHNHPSGDPTPSADDVTLTREAVAAAKLLDIEILDHVIIGGERRYASLSQLGVSFT